MTLPRLHLAEIEDQPWCPRPVRDAATDYLGFVLEKTRPYAAIAPRLRAALARSGTDRVVDLCSGAGGPWPWLLPLLAEEGAASPQVVLTDYYPNLDALRRAEAAVPGVTHVARPVDARAVPPELNGFRTLFTGFHHFRPEDARAILADAVEHGRGIGIFEASERSAAGVVGMLFAPLLVLGTTPFIRPFRWSRLLLTYLIPAVPLVGLVDGVVSALRTYTVEELEAMTAGLDAFVWEAGVDRAKGQPGGVTWLIGTPRRRGPHPASSGHGPEPVPESP